ncbi:MAG: NADH-quinone oxidoreductase subunit L [Desulfosarcinaceae bacterium]|jgi:NADH-quinone oxidoreductase subunit L
MHHWLWLVPTLPFAGFLVLSLGGGRMTRRAICAVGAGSVGISAGLALAVSAGYLSAAPSGRPFIQVLWQWFAVGGLTPRIALYLDPLSLIMMLVITGVGFLIHLYSTEFMGDDPGARRFFAYMNLFVGSMLVLVLADNFLLLYLGWEGVGLCSYLLIGFWYTDPQNGYAARKAFVVTRIGDTAMAIGLFILFTQLGTLQIQEGLARAGRLWAAGTVLPTAAALLLLGGAVGKSAQLPLQTWLPDAMAGPSPVSALIHAATMVTAGVYLIARTHLLFALAPQVMTLVAVIGAATLLMAGFSGLVQRDIKRVLAYSTISQIGYMFLALGVGAWSAALFHFMVHAFFKALLFLGAGVVIMAMDDEHDMFKMGGLRHRLPVTFWTFLVGSCALSAVPLVTAGFYSKDLIIWQAYASTRGGTWLWAAAVAGALLTSMYTFRMVVLTFFGAPAQTPRRRPGWRLKLPLIVLAALSLVAGFVQVPETLGGVSLFSDLLHGALPAVVLSAAREGSEGLFEVISGVVSLGGIVLVILVMGPARRLAASGAGALLHRWWYAGWGFDRLYDLFFIFPYSRLAQIGREDLLDWIYRWCARAAVMGNRTLVLTQTGRTRTYLAAIAWGAAAVIGLAVLL